MFAEQLRHHDNLFSPGVILSTVFRGVSSERTEDVLREVARRLDLPKIVYAQKEQPFGFYSCFFEYVENIRRYGHEQASVRLHDRLYTNLVTMDQEARRSYTTHPIPLHFVRVAESPAFTWRAIGREGDWKNNMLKMIEEKPPGEERDHFFLEARVVIDAFDELLSPLEKLSKREWEEMSEEKRWVFLGSLGYQQQEIPVTRLLSKLFPQLADRYGKTVSCLVSPHRLNVYPPSPFHLEGKSSFINVKSVAYAPDLGFFGLDQGLMSGYTIDDLREIVAALTGRETTSLTEEELLQMVFQSHDEKQWWTPQKLFAYIKTIVPFKQLTIEDFVSKSHCSDETIHNFIQVLQSVFEKEMIFIASHPKYAASSQARNEVFSRYIAFALGLNEALPVQEMLAKYDELLHDKEAALRPAEHVQQIDQSFSQAYGNLLKVPLRLESLFECSVVGGIKLSSGQMSASLGTAFSPDFLAKGISLSTLREGIAYRRQKDFGSVAEAREFAKMYGIDPNWIGTVIKHYPNGTHCDECDHDMHWVGKCGDHTMCLQCNAEYNLKHGLVPEQFGSQGSLLDKGSRSSQEVSSESEDLPDQGGLSPFVASLFTGREVYIQ